MFGTDGFDAFKGFSNMGGDWSKNMSALGNSTGLQQAAFSDDSTFGVISEFKFLAARSIRNSTIILASFNTVSAFATAVAILYDCYKSAKRADPRGTNRVNIFTCVRGPEIYPFFLSVGIAIQGIVFAVSQSEGLDGLFKGGCSLISQIMWPAIFIVPYIQLVFGLEVTFRAIRTRPFPPRGKWNVAICLALIKIMLLITGLVGFFVPAPNFCFASLFWFVARWAEGGFVILLITAVLLAICTVVIFLKLTRYAMIENDQRVSASRMVYYLALGVITNALMVPFFIYLTFSSPMDSNGGPGLTLSMIATVVANVTGLMTGGLHLFLRSNTISTIGPKNKLAEYERQKLKYQIGKPSDMDYNDHILQPVPGPRSLRRAESQESLVGHEKHEMDDLDELENNTFGYSQFSPRDPNPLRSNAVFSPTSAREAPEPTPIPPNPLTTTVNRKPSISSYTLFPSKNQNNTASTTLLPSTTYTPNSNANANLAPPNDQFLGFGLLKPPPSIVPASSRHRRNSSMASSATVQIGLRLSNVKDMQPMTNKAGTEAENSALQCPNRVLPSDSHRPSPLAAIDGAESTTSQSRPESPASIASQDENHSSAPTDVEAEDKKECTLNPTVYDPNSPTKSKIPSPKGVGFNVPRRVNTTPIQGSTQAPPSRTRGNSSTTGGKSQWI